MDSPPAGVGSAGLEETYVLQSTRRYWALGVQASHAGYWAGDRTPATFRVKVPLVSRNLGRILASTMR